MTNHERREKLREINSLIFEIESSYPYNYDNPHPIRRQLYRSRIELGAAENQIRREQREEQGY